MNIDLYKVVIFLDLNELRKAIVEGRYVTIREKLIDIETALENLKLMAEGVCVHISNRLEKLLQEVNTLDTKRANYILSGYKEQLYKEMLEQFDKIVKMFGEL